MTTLPPIQPRPILCKTAIPTTNNIQPSSSSVFLIHSSAQPSTVLNTNFYPTNTDLTNNNNSSQVLPAPIPSTPLSSYEEFLKRLREFHRCRQYVSFHNKQKGFISIVLEQHFVVYRQLLDKLLIYKHYIQQLLVMVVGIK